MKNNNVWLLVSCLVIAALMLVSCTPAVTEEEAAEAQELEFEGTIEAIDGNIWTMTIEGETRKIDASEAEIYVEPTVGLQVKIEGTVVDDTIVAGKVGIKESEEPQPLEPPPTSEEPNPQEPRLPTPPAPGEGTEVTVTIQAGDSGVAGPSIIIDDSATGADTT